MNPQTNGIEWTDLLPVRIVVTRHKASFSSILVKLRELIPATTRTRNHSASVETPLPFSPGVIINTSAGPPILVEPQKRLPASTGTNYNWVRFAGQLAVLILAVAYFMFGYGTGKLQILWTVILSVSIYMMYQFAWQQIATKYGLHDKTMFVYITTRDSKWMIGFSDKHITMRTNCPASFPMRIFTKFKPTHRQLLSINNLTTIITVMQIKHNIRSST